MTISFADVPAWPGEKDWRFIEELQTPFHQKIHWDRQKKRENEADLRSGATFVPDFPDPKGLLETATADFRRFLAMGDIPENGAFKIVTGRIETAVPETYRIEVTADVCRVLAGDTEGVRRGLVFLEDQIQRSGGPFLSLGEIERTPQIRTRVSRCFFGPIKRPPKSRDELLDDVNYYPDEYLNRLAHEGINGLWLTIEFKDLARTSIIPEYGQDAERRLAKLRQTIARCARYGVKIYLFCIEPAAFPENSPILARHPELGGHRGSGVVYFCPSSDLGKRYIEEATHSIFAAAPGLGGMINISVGERATICPNGGVNINNCPRCSKREPWEALSDALSAMERGMRTAEPNAELISWLYMPGSCYSGWSKKTTREGASHVPPNVILQHNFESNGGARQLGKWRETHDYWLSYIGPSPNFRECAKRATRAGTRVSAKLQVGCSHEVATAPFVPVPGNLYRKYKAMRDLGVSAVMQCWYFGNYPGLMNKAAGELSFGPFPKTEGAFLRSLAAIDWGRHAAKVARAWALFGEGYRNYPLGNLFGYYGPTHDGPTWPLYLEPRDLPLAPTWLLSDGFSRQPYPPSGDRIGEFICYTHTLEETLTLFERMADRWNEGVRILRSVKPDFADNPERLLDIGVAEALGVQFQSAANIVRFYALREKLADKATPEKARLLDEMERIVKEEIAGSETLTALCLADSRLGFHSEAEGHKYYPGKLQWRIRQLEEALKTEFPAIRARLAGAGSLFPAYTGERPEGPVYRCAKIAKGLSVDADPFSGVWETLPAEPCGYSGYYRFGLHEERDLPDPERKAFWKAAHDGEAMYFAVYCADPNPETARARLKDKELQKSVCEQWTDDIAEILIEPRRLWFFQTFLVNVAGARGHFSVGVEPSYSWDATIRRADKMWVAAFRIPFAALGVSPEKPIRINVGRRLPEHHDATGKKGLSRWVAPHPAQARLGYDMNNPADLGWLVFK